MTGTNPIGAAADRHMQARRDGGLEAALRIVNTDEGRGHMRAAETVLAAMLTDDEVARFRADGFLLPVVDVTGRETPAADAAFNAADRASWSIVADVLRRFAEGKTARIDI